MQHAREWADVRIAAWRVARLLCWLGLLSAAAIPQRASAANYSLWINGRGAGGTVGDYADFRYWGPPGTAGGINKKAVNWDGSSSIAVASTRVRDALDCFCTNPNWCYVAAYSAGDLLMGYILANYGSSVRTVRDPGSSVDGVCTPAGGASPTQTGWNIKWVRVAAGAAGGSELADAGAWTTNEPLVRDLRTSTARAMYDHNDTKGIWFHMYAGARGTAYSFLLPGQDDEVVAYHSSGAVSGNAGGAYCNPRDWFCNDLTLGTAVNQGGWPKWHFHSLQFRDDRERHSHYLNGNWDGITSVMRADMEAFAR